jgi:hypothetical protein
MAMDETIAICNNELNQTKKVALRKHNDVKALAEYTKYSSPKKREEQFYEFALRKLELEQCEEAIKEIQCRLDSYKPEYENAKQAFEAIRTELEPFSFAAQMAEMHGEVHELLRKLQIIRNVENGDSLPRQKISQGNQSMNYDSIREFNQNWSVTNDFAEGIDRNTNVCCEEKTPEPLHQLSRSGRSNEKIETCRSVESENAVDLLASTEGMSRQEVHQVCCVVS